MYKGKTIAVVVPCYNEETQIGGVITTMPALVDKVIVVNDKSTDNTSQVIQSMVHEGGRVVLVEHEKNQGVGGAIASGYKWCRDNGIDVAVVMAGDGQMNPDDLPALLDPVVNGEVDYSKGNRLFTGEAYQKIPKVRYFGNSVLSMFTKIASGYWHVADSQTGYTALNAKGLRLIDWDKMYKRYGQPNDLLVKLNVWDLKVRDVPVEPVYNVGEQSGIQLRKVIFTIPLLLLRLFFWRMKEKYMIRNFHPLVFFYFIGVIFMIAFVLLTARMLIYWWFITGLIPKVNALAALFSFMAASQFTLFAMWFDMEANKELK
ncbi:MAG: glycosyltransferase involved in cell wall biosynthesis [Bacteroidia bacterium]|jgi:glycosyltransferase involved in cell wall biosynthesis